MRGRRTIITLGAAVLMLVCASGAWGRAQVKSVTAGPFSKPKAAQLDFDAYFRRTVSVHVGDSVRWKINGFHTISFLAGQPRPAFAMPVPTDPVTGVSDAAGKPFFFNGLPNLHINPQVAFAAGGPTFDGSTYTNSGLPVGPAAGKPFVLKFTKAGTFRYFCLVHPGMTGTVKVLAKKKKIPTKAQDKKAAKAEQRTATKLAATLAKVNPGPAKVLAGNDKGSVAWLRFFPENLKIKAGQTVEFSNKSKPEIHTVTIGPAAYDSAIENSFTLVKQNPTGPPSVVLNPLAAYPSDPVLPPFNGTNHGNGFENTGILSFGGPQPSSAKVTFTKPGVYHYECVIHAGMDGTITVT
jgi:plastocyanin